MTAAEAFVPHWESRGIWYSADSEARFDDEGLSAGDALVAAVREYQKGRKT